MENKNELIGRAINVVSGAVIMVALILYGLGLFNYGKLAGTQEAITQFNNANLQGAFQEGGKAGYLQCQKELSNPETK